MGGSGRERKSDTDSLTCPDCGSGSRVYRKHHHYSGMSIRIDCQECGRFLGFSRHTDEAKKLSEIGGDYYGA